MKRSSFLFSISLGMAGMLLFSSCQKETIELIPASTARAQQTDSYPAVSSLKEHQGRSTTTPADYQPGLWIWYDATHFECAPFVNRICYTIIRPKLSYHLSSDDIVAALTDGEITPVASDSPESMNSFVKATDPSNEEIWLVPGVENPRAYRVNTFNAYTNTDGMYSVDVTYK